MFKYKSFFFVLLTIFSLSYSINAYASYQQTMDKLNQILDVSGDNYFIKAVDMIQNAKESVLMSMFLVENESQELMTLLQELDKALERGLEVELYVNARYNADDWAFLNNYFYASPRKAIKIHPVGDNHFLYHKMIIVDEKTILEGSINWSRDYNKDDLEYAIIQQDPLLAQNKILALHHVDHAKKEMENPDLLWRSKMSWIDKSVYEAMVPVRAVTEDDMLFALLDKGDDDLFDLYLMLLYQAALAKDKSFVVEYNELAFGLKLDTYKEKKQKKKVFKAIKKLSKRGMLEILEQSKDSLKVELTALSSPSFAVPIDILAPAFMREFTYEFKTAYLICALLNDIYSRSKDIYTDQQREHLKALLGTYKLAIVPPLLK